MTSVLFDTCILIDILRGKGEAVDCFDRHADDTANDPDGLLAVSAITVHELHQGMRPKEKARTEGLIGAFPVLRFGEDTARVSGALGQRYLKSHRRDAPDLIVAATAINSGSELITCNLKHFPMFPDLKLPYP